MALRATPLLKPEESRVHKAPVVVNERPLSFSAATLRTWGTKSALSLVDQGLTSGAGFIVNIYLARVLAPNVYGAFAVAFTGLLFVSGFHNVLLLEPLSVLGPSRHADRLVRFFRAQIAVHAVLVGVLSAAVLLSGILLWRVEPRNPLVGAILGAAFALPFLLLLWLARRMCYVVQLPSTAVAGSGSYLGITYAGLFVLARMGRIGSFSAFALIGLASACSTIPLFHKLGLWNRAPSPSGQLSWREALRGNWTYGRWLVGSTVLYSISTQTQAFLVAGILGLGAAGILRAMQIPSLAMTQIVTATGLLILPAFSHDFGRGSTGRIRHKAVLVSASLGFVALCFCLFLAIEAGRVEHVLFGGKYASDAWIMSVLALVPVANACSLGYSMALRASHRPDYDLAANAIVAPISLISSICFIRWWGISGVAASMALCFALLNGITFVCFSRFFSRNKLGVGMEND